MSVSQHAPPAPRSGSGSHPVTLDLHELGRRAQQARRAAFGDRATFSRARRLLASGAWRGPRDAALSFVEAEDVEAAGGLEAARAAGAHTLLVPLGAPPAARAAASGWRIIVRLPYRTDDSDAVVAERLARAAALAPWGVAPTPEDEAMGLTTLALFARSRLALPPAVHLVADVTRLDRRLGQMALGFGADDLLATVVAERALRLGDNARNTALTRKEVIALIRGAALVPCERHADDRLEECP